MSNIKVLDPITVAGVHYDSVADACTKLKIDVRFVLYRLNKGWDADVAFGVKEGATVWNTAITLGGVEYADLRHACKKLNKSEKRIMDCLKRGESLEYAFGIEKRRIKKETEVFGYTFDSFKDATDAFGLSYGKTNQRINTYKFGIGSAFDLDDSQSPIEVNGRLYPTLVVAVEELDAHIPTVFRRLRQGWTADEAFGFTRRGNTPVGKFELGGIIYQDIEDALEHYGLPYWKAIYAMDMGVAPEEVFGLEFKTPERNIHYGDEEPLTGYLYIKGSDKKIAFYKGKRFESLMDLKRYLVQQGVFRSESTANSTFTKYKNVRTLGEITGCYKAPVNAGKRGIIYKGMVYPNLKVLCDTLDLQYVTVSGRIKKNPKMSAESIIDMFMKAKQGVNSNKVHGKGITYKRVWYPNLRDMCDKLGLDYAQAQREIKFKKGKTTQEVITTLLVLKDVTLEKEKILAGCNFEYRGKAYSNYHNLCERLNISESKVRSALSQRRLDATFSDKDYAFIFDAVIESQREVIASYEKNQSKRVGRKPRGLSDSDIAKGKNNCLITEFKKHDFHGNVSDSELLLNTYTHGADFIKDRALPAEVAFFAHNRRESVDSAINYLLTVNSVKGDTEISYEGVTYKNAFSLCDTYKVDVRYFLVRQLYGWSIRECLGIIKRRTGRRGECVFAYKGVMVLSARHLLNWANVPHSVNSFNGLYGKDILDKVLSE